jgi:TonB family protein
VSILRALVAALPLFLLSGLVHGQSAETDAALQLYTLKLVQTGMKIRTYPAAAQARGEEGSVTVEISMSANGKLDAANLIESSGHASLDSHALALLGQAVPMTEIPAALHNRAFSFRVVLAFKLP